MGLGILYAAGRTIFGLAGKILQLQLIDHVIIGSPAPVKNSYFSCPFCKQAKGDIRRNRGGFLGVCPNCDAKGPRRENWDEALRAWNGRS